MRDKSTYGLIIVDETLLAAFFKQFPIELNKPIFVLRKGKNSLSM